MLRQMVHIVPLENGPGSPSPAVYRRSKVLSTSSSSNRSRSALDALHVGYSCVGGELSVRLVSKSIHCRGLFIQRSVQEDTNPVCPTYANTVSRTCWLPGFIPLLELVSNRREPFGWP